MSNPEKYPSTVEIKEEAKSLVRDNFRFENAIHNRENLDDLISDLIQYRDSLPTWEQYQERYKGVHKIFED